MGGSELGEQNKTNNSQEGTDPLCSHLVHGDTKQQKTGTGLCKKQLLGRIIVLCACLGRGETGKASRFKEVFTVCVCEGDHMHSVCP